MNCFSGIYSFRKNNHVSQNRIKKMHEIDYLSSTKTTYYLNSRLGLICSQPKENLTRCFQLNSIDDEHLHIVFGGAIYNSTFLWEQVNNAEIRDIDDEDKSDGKLILLLYKKYKDDFLNYLNGKFAIAIYDEKNERLISARDRFGIEPLYYYRDNDNFVFSSRITPILKSGLFTPKPNIDRIYNFLEHSNVGGDQTFFKDVFELPMGHYLVAEKDEFKIIQWYDISKKKVNLENMEEQEIVDGFSKLFTDSIKIRTDNNKIVYTALSGGIDSSYVVCKTNNMKQQGLLNADIETISLRFNDLRYDEGEYINAVLDDVATTHHNIYPDGSSIIIDNLNDVIKYFEEPFHKIHVPLYWELARKAEQMGISSILFGQGAESIIGGQSSTDYIMRIIELLKDGKFGKFKQEIKKVSKIHKIPFTRILAKVFLQVLPLSNLSRKMFRRNSFVVTNELADRRIKNFSTPHKYSNRLTQAIFEDLYFQPYEFRVFCKNKYNIDNRFPFMDHRLVEFSYSMPDSLKIDLGVSKIILRKDGNILPSKIRNRTDKKMSANIMDKWFRTILKSYVLKIINSKSFNDRDIFDVKKIRKMVESHNNGSINIGKEIARWITVELWFRYFFDSKDLQ
ncbi:MAG: hypothetical protein K8S23_10080 [Candidatus Cloacimonetes bacterium]|nr:hypothetical protein [Candidatus Cloacimonadota bacterium]